MVPVRSGPYVRAVPKALWMEILYRYKILYYLYIVL